MRSLAAIALAACLLATTAAQAAPIQPASDDQVIETLPAGSTGRTEERRLRRELLARPGDAPKALRLAGLLMSQARASGEPRLAGQALAALQPWSDPATAPAEVLLMQATVRQHLHEFDAAAALLEQALARNAQQPQAWLTLATVRRVQGRYADSDRACAQLLTLAAGLHGAACRAENDALRGEFDGARQRLLRLLAVPGLDAGTRNWLLISLAQLEERAGGTAAADRAYQAALAAQPDAYGLVAYADFLIAQQRHGEALALLRGQPRTDAVLLRLAIAGTRSGAAQAGDDAREMRERIREANQRPQAQLVHAREQAMFALWVDGEPQRAIALARHNLQLQREPVDLLLLAQAGLAAREPAARRDAAALGKEMGLHDRRLDALR